MTPCRGRILSRGPHLPPGANQHAARGWLLIHTSGSDQQQRQDLVPGAGDVVGWAPHRREWQCGAPGDQDKN